MKDIGMEPLDPRPMDPLDMRLDASLRRLFTPPGGIGELALRPETAPGQGRPASWPTALLAAAAAALLLWLFVRSSDPVAPRSEPASGAAGALAGLPPVGPLEECQAGEPSAVRAPDLTVLYRAMDACQRGPALQACGDEDRLAETLGATYGEEVRIRPGAAALLHGPFSSPEWPTGTILTGQADEQTAVIVAESHETLACCLSVELAEDSGLRFFTWRVGDLVLTEITPLEEPRLLEFFE
jgi:hypothetical protein